MSKPSNWYEMDYDQQREWEQAERKHSRELDDARYEQEQAERAANARLRDAREAAESERYRAQEVANEHASEIEEANDRIAELESEKAQLLSALESIMTNQLGGNIDHDAKRFKDARELLTKHKAE